MEDSTTKTKKPTCIIVLGMAGSGKTTFVGQLISHLNSVNQSVYAINLDPAVHHIPYEPNIDIRDTVKFKEVMKQYGFGPNGAIMTSLNFFASQFNKVVDLIEKKSNTVSYVVLDTPGQIEVFTWSASGTIISESLGSAFPTLVVYVMDTPRSHNPVTFMSNMLYACSVLYRMRLPFLVVLNKTDIIDCTFAIEWMRDFEAFQDALAGHRSSTDPAEMEDELSSLTPGTSPYMNSLMNSMSLVLDEFYSQLRCCGVSSVTGDGMSHLMEKIEEATQEYYLDYLPLLRGRKPPTSVESDHHSGADPSTSSCTLFGQENNTKKTDHESIDFSVAKHSKESGNKSMLVDLIGDNDDAEDDPLVELDGTEQREGDELPDEDNEDEDNKLIRDIRSVSDQFKRVCRTGEST